MISINTVREMADKVYGENNYNMEENYCHIVGRSNRRPSNARKVYRFSANGTEGTWITAREAVDIFTKVINR